MSRKEIFYSDSPDPLKDLFRYVGKKAPKELTTTELINLSSQLENVVATYYWMIIVLVQRYLEAAENAGIKAGVNGIIKKVLSNKNFAIHVVSYKSYEVVVNYKLAVNNKQFLEDNLEEWAMKQLGGAYDTHTFDFIHLLYSFGWVGWSRTLKLPAPSRLGEPNLHPPDVVFDYITKYVKKARGYNIDERIITAIRKLVKKRDKEIKRLRAVDIPKTVEKLLNTIKGVSKFGEEFTLDIVDNRPDKWDIYVEVNDDIAMEITLVPFHYYITIYTPEGDKVKKDYPLPKNATIKEVVEQFVAVLRDTYQY